MFLRSYFLVWVQVQAAYKISAVAIFCLDIITPSFIYRPTVTRLYMERVQVLDMQNIFCSLPSPQYLTLVDMLYFDCKWLKDMPEHITLMGNTCQSEEQWITSTQGELVIIDRVTCLALFICKIL